MQLGVQDVSLAGGNPSTPPVEVSGIESDVRGKVGVSVGLVRRGRESSFNNLDDFVLGPEGLCCGPSCEPNGLELGEVQGLFNELQVDLGRVSKPIDLNGLKGYSEGVTGVGFGPVSVDATGEGALDGDKPPVTLSRAQSEPSISKERGVSGGASGDDDPLVKLSRDALPTEAFETTERGSMTVEALREEATRYIESLSFPVGGQELSSSTPSSGFGRAMLNEGSFGGLASVTNREEQIPLTIILAYGSNGEMASEGEKSVVGKGVGGEFEELLQDLEGKGCRWDDSCLARFSKFLGFSTEGFEGEILNLLLRTKRRRKQNNKKGTLGSIKFDCELKKLEWSINYNGTRKEQRVDLVCLQETNIQDMS